MPSSPDPSASTARGDSLRPPREERRRAPADLPAAEFRDAGHALVDSIADFLEGIRDRPVTSGASPGTIRERLDAGRGLPAKGRDAGALLAETTRLLFEHSLHNGHPRFLGYITSSAAPVGILGEMLAAAVNPNVGAWTLSPVASEIERQTVSWIAELLGYPRDAGGLLVSGGNMANMVALWAARTAAAGQEIRSRGADAVSRFTVYGSAETHTWVQKAADLSGMGTDAIRWIPTRQDLTMDLEALEATLDGDVARGLTPLMVIGTAGSVSTGAVDDLEGMSRICRQRGIWLHVDGAYGGFAAMVPDAPAGLRHLALADSVAVDPHKWLYAPLEAGCILVREESRLRDAFSYHPPYYHFGVEATNHVDLGPQNSRGFRALKVWLALQQVGRDGYEEMLADDIRLARLLHRAVEETPGLEAVTCALSITTFRFVPEELQDRTGEPDVGRYLDALNEAIQGRLEREGEVFLSNAVVRGRYLLRGCIVNFRTDREDVLAIPDIVVRAGEALHREMGAASRR